MPPKIPPFAEMAYAVGTVALYERTVAHILLAGMTPDAWACWFRKEVSKRQPLNTLLVKRAVAKALLMANDIGEEDSDRMLGHARGLPAVMSEALDDEQWLIYLREARATAGNVGIVLRLLPWTGLRISEACGLCGVNIEERPGGRLSLVFRGKGSKVRHLPIHRKIEDDIRGAWQRAGGRGSSTPLFPDVDPRCIREVMARMEAAHPELGRLHPHRLRHTFATRANSRGAKLPVIQVLMGHADARTTIRYIHPGHDDLVATIDLLG